MVRTCNTETTLQRAQTLPGYHSTKQSSFKSHWYFRKNTMELCGCLVPFLCNLSCDSRSQYLKPIYAERLSTRDHQTLQHFQHFSYCWPAHHLRSRTSPLFLSSCALFFLPTICVYFKELHVVLELSVYLRTRRHSAILPIARYCGTQHLLHLVSKSKPAKASTAGNIEDILALCSSQDVLVGDFVCVCCLIFGIWFKYQRWKKLKFFSSQEKVVNVSLQRRAAPHVYNNDPEKYKLIIFVTWFHYM